jgi:hypothetical protein
MPVEPNPRAFGRHGRGPATCIPGDPGAAGESGKAEARGDLRCAATHLAHCRIELLRALAKSAATAWPPDGAAADAPRRGLTQENSMRRKNWRIVIVGLVLVAAAAAFFVFMQGTAPRSNDPVALMQTVGQVAGAVGGLGLVLFIVGLVGRR